MAVRKKTTRRQKIDALVKLVGFWDVETLIEAAKENQRRHYETLTDAQLLKEYRELVDKGSS